MTEKINRGFLAPTTFFIIIVFYLLRSLLSSPNTQCNPFVTYSTYFVSILDILMVIVSGYWMAHRIRSQSTNETKIDEEKGETAEISLPDEGL